MRSLKLNKLTFVILTLIFTGAVNAQTEEKVPIYGILMDNTGSMRIELPRMISLAKVTIDGVKDGAAFSIFKFEFERNTGNAIIAAEIECNTNVDQVRQEVDNIFILGGQTTLFDAIKTAAARISEEKPDGCVATDERNLILITDGEDRTSRIKLDDLAHTLKTARIKVFAVGLITSNHSKRKRLRKNLETIAEATGGRAVFPGKEDSAEEIFEALFGLNPELPK